jgi:hypothetical protein
MASLHAPTGQLVHRLDTLRLLSRTRDPRSIPRFAGPLTCCASYALLVAFLRPAICRIGCPKLGQLSDLSQALCLYSLTLLSMPSPPPTYCGDPAVSGIASLIVSVDPELGRDIAF